MIPRQGIGVLVLSALAACHTAPAPPSNHIVVAIGNAPVQLDPAMGLDEASQRVHQLVFSSLAKTGPDLRVVPDLAESIETIDGSMYRVTLPAGVRFHDGRPLTSADVAYTFRRFLDPSFPSPRRGAYLNLAAIDVIDEHTVVFRLHQPSSAFPINLANMGIVPDGAGPELAHAPVGTGPYRLVDHRPDDRTVLEAFADHYRGAPANDGITLRVVPDETMRGLELRKGGVDLIVNDIGPDLVHGLAREGVLHVVTAPGLDFAYLGMNLRDPALADVRVRQAIAHAIDRDAITRHLRRGLARVADGILPPLSWAAADDLPTYDHDPARARALLDAAGYLDPDGDGPAPRLRLTLKTSTTESYRLQAAVIQQHLAAAGIALELRSYEFATLFADVISGNVQLYTLILVGGSVTDPDILRRVYHSAQTPPAGFNRAFYRNAAMDRLLDLASSAFGDEERRGFYVEAQRIAARDVPLLGLWRRTNVAVAQPDLRGLALSPTGDFDFLWQVRREPRSGTGTTPAPTGR